MAKRILRAGLYFIGIAGILIGLSSITFGFDATGQFFRNTLSIVYPSGELKGLENANADSELRFYSVFWIAYGSFMVQTAKHIDRFIDRVPLLLGLFFAGGAARFISYMTAGTPHSLFMLLMIIELVMPLILGLSWLRTRAQK